MAVFTLFIMSSCKTINIKKYYSEHKDTLDSLHTSYQQLSTSSHFSVQFNDNTYKNITLEVWTDSLKYIYDFAVAENRLKDTLAKYHVPVNPALGIIEKMQRIHCTWINNLDYYINKRPNHLVFMSIWPRRLYTPFTNKKYYILTWFNQPQYFDKNGILMDGRRLRRGRKINNDVFRRVNDKVAYTISDRFR